MLQVEEKIQKAAEGELTCQRSQSELRADIFSVGKQTFNNLFSLAKSKYAEFQQNQAQNQAQGQSGSQRAGGLWGGEQQQPGSAAGWGRGGTGATTGGYRGGAQNYGYGQQQSQGYRGQDDQGS